MRERNLWILLIGLPLLAVSTLTACGDEGELAGLEDAEAVFTMAGGEDAERHLTRLREELDLTDAQVAGLRTIFEEGREEFEALRESGPDDLEARHEALRGLHAEVHERMSAVLTEEQQERLEELVRSHDGSHGPRGARHHGS